VTVMQGAEPYLMPGGKRGVLLIHGFTGSPSEMRLMGEFLNTQGYTVFAPRLCGHGSTPEDMEETGWKQWYADAEDGFCILSGCCSDISVVGLSMGGLLSLKLASEYPVARLVAMSTPIYIADRRLPMLPVLRLFRSYAVRRRRKMAGIDPAYSVCYDRTPLKSVASLLELIKHVDGLIPQVHTPALIVQSQNDRTVRPKSARHIYELISSREKTLMWLEQSGHIVTLDSERSTVFQAVDDFLRT
jgi:carboxylesterase